MSELPAWTPILSGDGKPCGYWRRYGCMVAEVRHGKLRCGGEPTWEVWGAGTFLGPYAARSIRGAACAAALMAMAFDLALDMSTDIPAATGCGHEPYNAWAGKQWR